MCIIIVIVVIVLLVLYCMGIFNKPANCQCCGTLLKGTQQVKFGEIKSEFILCKNCSQKVHPFIKDYAPVSSIGVIRILRTILHGRKKQRMKGLNLSQNIHMDLMEQCR